jgi:hypothetical protein
MWVIKHVAMGYLAGYERIGGDLWANWCQEESEAYRFQIKPNLKDYAKNSAGGLSMMEAIDVGD